MQYSNFLYFLQNLMKSHYLHWMTDHKARLLLVLSPRTKADDVRLLHVQVDPIRYLDRHLLHLYHYFHLFLHFIPIHLHCKLI